MSATIVMTIITAIPSPGPQRLPNPFTLPPPTANNSSSHLCHPTVNPLHQRGLKLPKTCLLTTYSTTNRVQTLQETICYACHSSSHNDNNNNKGGGKHLALTHSQVLCPCFTWKNMDILELTCKKQTHMLLFFLFICFKYYTTKIIDLIKIDVT